jgi:hypothetical protein
MTERHDRQKENRTKNHMANGPLKKTTTVGQEGRTASRGRTKRENDRRKNKISNSG